MVFVHALSLSAASQTDHDLKSNERPVRKNNPETKKPKTKGWVTCLQSPAEPEQKLQKEAQDLVWLHIPETSDAQCSCPVSREPPGKSQSLVRTPWRRPRPPTPTHTTVLMPLCFGLVLPALWEGGGGWPWWCGGP